MKRLVMIIGGVVIVLVAVAAYLLLRPRVSVPATATMSSAGVDVKVAYSRPLKKGRLIFGEKSAGALVPFGEVWRTGANEATEISFSKNVLFAGKSLKAGTYTLFTIPRQDKWTIIINGETGQWGLFYKAEKDVLRVEVPVQAPAAASVEIFTINLEPTATGVNLVLMWDATIVSVPIDVQQ
jgi:hypothetical protein